MASLCIYCRGFPHLCPKCSVSLSGHLCRRWTFRAADRGLCLGRLGDDQAKGRPRTSCLQYLQYLRRVDALTRQALHELRRGLVVKHIQRGRCTSLRIQGYARIGRTATPREQTDCVQGCLS